MKESIKEHMDELSDAARVIGAVNTVRHISTMECLPTVLVRVKSTACEQCCTRGDQVQRPFQRRQHSSLLTQGRARCWCFCLAPLQHMRKLRCSQHQDWLGIKNQLEARLRGPPSSFPHSTCDELNRNFSKLSGGRKTDKLTCSTLGEATGGNGSKVFFRTWLQ